MTIAYNNFWADRHGMKAANLQKKVEGFDMGIKALDNSKTEIASVLKDLGMTGDKLLDVKMKEIDRQRNALSNKRNATQSAFDASVNRANLYTEKRDNVADKLIDRYTGILSPLERKMEGLNESKAELGVLITGTEARLDAQNDKIDDIESKRDKLEKSLLSSGLSEREVNKIIKGTFGVIEKQLAGCRKAVEAELNDLNKKRIDTDSKIVKVSEKMTPYRDRKNQFISVKADGPIVVDKAKTAGENAETADNVGSGVETPGEVSERGEETDSAEKESGMEAGKNSVEGYLAVWNKLCKDKMGKDQILQINQEDFLKKCGLKKDFILKTKQFKKVLEGYLLKLKKTPANVLKDAIKKFDKLDESVK